RGSSPARKLSGSSRAAASWAKSSSVTYRRAESPGEVVRSVLLPVWRMPVRTTTGMSSRAALMEGTRSRGKGVVMFTHDMRLYDAYLGDIATTVKPSQRRVPAQQRKRQ